MDTIRRRSEAAALVLTTAILPLTGCGSGASDSSDDHAAQNPCGVMDRSLVTAYVGSTVKPYGNLTGSSCSFVHGDQTVLRVQAFRIDSGEAARYADGIRRDRAHTRRDCPKPVFVNGWMTGYVCATSSSQARLVGVTSDLSITLAADAPAGRRVTADQLTAIAKAIQAKMGR